MAKKLIQILFISSKKFEEKEQKEKLEVEKQYKQLFGENLKDSLMEPMDFEEAYENYMDELKNIINKLNI